MFSKDAEIPFLDRKIETAPREEIERIQLEGLKKQIKSALRTEFYRKKYDGLGITEDTVSSLDDIRRLPFTTKNDLRDAYPFGLLAVPKDDVVRLHASSGTTGAATVIYLTQKDLDTASDTMARSLRAAAAGVCALGFVLGCVFSGAVFGGETRIVAGGYYGGGMVLVRSGEGTVMILVCGTYPGGIGTFAGTYAPGGVDDLIIVGGDECARYYYECGVDAQRVWLPPGSIALGGLDGAQVRYEGQFELYGTQYGFGDDYTLSAAAGGVTFAVCTGGYADMDRVDVAFCMQPPKGAAANTWVCFNGMTGDFNLYSQGCLQFIANGGTLIMTGCIPEK